MKSPRHPGDFIQTLNGLVDIEIVVSFDCSLSLNPVCSTIVRNLIQADGFAGCNHLCISDLLAFL